jgi:hypothetical protein
MPSFHGVGLSFERKPDSSSDCKHAKIKGGDGRFRDFSKRQAVDQLGNRLFPDIPKFADVEQRPN